MGGAWPRAAKGDDYGDPRDDSSRGESSLRRDAEGAAPAGTLDRRRAEEPAPGRAPDRGGCPNPHQGAAQGGQRADRDAPRAPERGQRGAPPVVRGGGRLVACHQGRGAPPAGGGPRGLAGARGTRGGDITAGGPGTRGEAGAPASAIVERFRHALER